MRHTKVGCGINEQVNSLRVDHVQFRDFETTLHIARKQLAFGSVTSIPARRECTHTEVGGHGIEPAHYLRLRTIRELNRIHEVVRSEVQLL